MTRNRISTVWMHHILRLDFAKPCFECRTETAVVPSNKFALNAVVPSFEGQTPLDYLTLWAIQMSYKAINHLLPGYVWRNCLILTGPSEKVSVEALS